MKLPSFILPFLLSTSTLAADTDAWRSRTIYQVFTDRFARTDGSLTAPCNVNAGEYCGGTWRGLINKLDYIKNMGFTAVWISPVTANIDKGYHGYWQNDLYSVNSHFGTPQDLKDLAAALHSRGMYLMVDIVTNHMGWWGAPETMDLTQMKPFDHVTDYNPYCPMAYDQQSQIELCWIGDPNSVILPDLKTTDSSVRAEFNSWIKGLVSNYSIDGLRIDSVKNVEMDFWADFCVAANAFCFGEVSDGRQEYTYPYSFVDGLDSITDYPMYYAVTRVFASASPMPDLVANLDKCKNGGCKDSTSMGAFLENHDNPRFPSLTPSLALVKNALAYTILSDGIPIIYQGQEQHLSGTDDPGCREAIWLGGYDTNAELYKHIALLNQIRNTAMLAAPAVGVPPYRDYQNWATAYTESVVQLRKDPVRTVLSNEGDAAGSYQLTTQGMGFVAGETVVEILSCDEYTANSNGEVELHMGQGLPKVLWAANGLAGTGLCGH